MAVYASEMSLEQIVTNKLLIKKSKPVESDMMFYNNGEIKALEDILCNIKVCNVKDFIEISLVKETELLTILNDCTRDDTKVVEQISGYENTVHDFLLLINPFIDEEQDIFHQIENRLNELID